MKGNFGPCPLLLSPQGAIFLPSLDFPGDSEGKESACNAGDPSSIPGSGRSPGEGNGNPRQYSCLENPMDRGTWRVTVHRVAKSQTRLSTHRLSCSMTCGIFLDQGWNLCLLHWQADSLPLSHQGRSSQKALKNYFGCAVGHMRSQFPNQGWNPCLLHWKSRVLTTRPLGKSLVTSLHPV